MNVTVTGVSGPVGLGIMKKLGADEVIDSRRTSIPKVTGKLDAVLDLPNRNVFRSVRHLLRPNGVFVRTNPQDNVMAFAENLARGQNVNYLFVDQRDSESLTELAGQIADGTIRAGPVQGFDFQDFDAAFASLHESGQLGGSVLRLR